MKILIFSILILLSVSCSQNNIDIQFFDESKPDSTAIKFAPELISTISTNEYGGHYSPNGKSFYFTRFIQGETANIYVTHYSEGNWSIPEKISIMDKFRGTESNFSPDGKTFIYNREFDNPDSLDLDIYIADHLKQSFINPRQITKINLGQRRVCPSLAKNGNLYFSGNYSDTTNADIYISKFINGKYTSPEKLIGGINSEFNEFHAWISPDENWILFDSNRPDGYGASDLYICFKNKKGFWGDAINLGKEFNTEGWDWYPIPTPDFKYIIFARSGKDGIDMYWNKLNINKFKSEL